MNTFSVCSAREMTATCRIVILCLLSYSCYFYCCCCRCCCCCWCSCCSLAAVIIITIVVVVFDVFIVHVCFRCSNFSVSLSFTFLHSITLLRILLSIKITWALKCTHTYLYTYRKRKITFWSVFCDFFSYFFSTYTHTGA